MAPVDSLALFARNDLTRRGLRDAAELRGLAVIDLDSDPKSVVHAAGPGVAFRAPGGLMASAIERGATAQLFGPTPEWFVSLGPDITGRRWHLVTPTTTRAMFDAGPVFVKLADPKRRDMPARRYRAWANSTPSSTPPASRIGCSFWRRRDGWTLIRSTGSSAKAVPF